MALKIADLQRGYPREIGTPPSEEEREVNRDTSSRLQYWANYLFYMVPVLAATYIALVLVPAASARWPARFISWQELSLLILVIVLSFASARPLYRLRHDMLGLRSPLNGYAAALSLFALACGAAAYLINHSRWVVGAFIVGAALPPVISGLTAANKHQPDRRFNM